MQRLQVETGHLPGTTPGGALGLRGPSRVSSPHSCLRINRPASDLGI